MSNVNRKRIAVALLAVVFTLCLGLAGIKPVAPTYGEGENLATNAGKWVLDRSNWEAYTWWNDPDSTVIDENGIMLTDWRKSAANGGSQLINSAALSYFGTVNPGDRVTMVFEGKLEFDAENELLSQGDSEAFKLNFLTVRKEFAEKGKDDLIRLQMDDYNYKMEQGAEIVSDWAGIELAKTYGTEGAVVTNIMKHNSNKVERSAGEGTLVSESKDFFDEMEHTLVIETAAGETGVTYTVFIDGEVFNTATVENADMLGETCISMGMLPAYAQDNMQTKEGNYFHIKSFTVEAADTGFEGDYVAIDAENNWLQYEQNWIRSQDEADGIGSVAFNNDDTVTLSNYYRENFYGAYLKYGEKIAANKTYSVAFNLSATGENNMAVFFKNKSTASAQYQLPPNDYWGTDDVGLGIELKDGQLTVNRYWKQLGMAWWQTEDSIRKTVGNINLADGKDHRLDVTVEDTETGIIMDVALDSVLLAEDLVVEETLLLGEGSFGVLAWNNQAEPNGSICTIKGVGVYELDGTPIAPKVPEGLGYNPIADEYNQLRNIDQWNLYGKMTAGDEGLSVTDWNSLNQWEAVADAAALSTNLSSIDQNGLTYSMAINAAFDGDDDHLYLYVMNTAAGKGAQASDPFNYVSWVAGDKSIVLDFTKERLTISKYEFTTAWYAGTVELGKVPVALADGEDHRIDIKLEAGADAVSMTVYADGDRLYTGSLKDVGYENIVGKIGFSFSENTLAENTNDKAVIKAVAWKDSAGVYCDVTPSEPWTAPVIAPESNLADSEFSWNADRSKVVFSDDGGFVVENFSASAHAAAVVNVDTASSFKISAKLRMEGFTSTDLEEGIQINLKNYKNDPQASDAIPWNSKQLSYTVFLGVNSSLRTNYEDGTFTYGTGISVIKYKSYSTGLGFPNAYVQNVACDSILDGEDHWLEIYCLDYVNPDNAKQVGVRIQVYVDGVRYIDFVDYDTEIIEDGITYKWANYEREGAVGFFASTNTNTGDRRVFVSEFGVEDYDGEEVNAWLATTEPDYPLTAKKFTPVTAYDVNENVFIGINSLFDNPGNYTLNFECNLGKVENGVWKYTPDAEGHYTVVITASTEDLSKSAECRFEFDVEGESEPEKPSDGDGNDCAGCQSGAVGLGLVFLAAGAIALKLRK